MYAQEERFLYPAYPLVCLVATDVVLGAVVPVFNYLLSCDPLSGRPGRLVRWVAVGISCLLGSSRIYSNYRNYAGFVTSKLMHMNITYFHLRVSKPHLCAGIMATWTELGNDAKLSFNGLTKTINVCTGNDWYSFPSHFFVDSPVKLRFIEEDFRGILPQYYGARPWDTPLQPFNNRNKEERSRYVDLQECDYFVILREEGDLETGSSLSRKIREYVSSELSFTVVAAEPVIHSSRSPVITRAFFIPFLSEKKNVFSKYTAYRRSKI